MTLWGGPEAGWLWSACSGISESRWGLTDRERLEEAAAFRFEGLVRGHGAAADRLASVEPSATVTVRSLFVTRGGFHPAGGVITLPV